MNSFPMIEACVRSGNGLGMYQDTFYGYYACPDCGHEATRQEAMFVFDCGWCERKAIGAVYRKPRKDGTVEEETKVNPLIFCVYDDANSF